MPIRIHPLEDLLARAVELPVAAPAIAGAAALVLFGLAVAGAQPWWCLRRRAARSFVAALSTGDLELAERTAGRALGGGSSPRRAARVPQRSWDEQVVVGCSRLEAAKELRSAAGRAAIWPTVRTVLDEDGGVLVVGRRRPVRLRLLSHCWLPSEGMRFALDSGGRTVVGHVLVRPVRSADAGAAEVWVHVEGDDCRRSRRVLRAMRRATRPGLRRWASGRRLTRRRGD